MDQIPWKRTGILLDRLAEVYMLQRGRDSECEGREKTRSLSQQSGVITGVITVTAHCCATGREGEHCFFLGNRRVYGDRSLAVFSRREARAHARILAATEKTLFSIDHFHFFSLRPFVAKKYSRKSCPLQRATRVKSVLFVIIERLIEQRTTSFPAKRCISFSI